MLRVARIDALSAPVNLPAIFKGVYEDERIHDYLCTAVSYSMAAPTPLQIGGDDVGERTHVRVGLSSVDAVWMDEDDAEASPALAPLSLLSARLPRATA